MKSLERREIIDNIEFEWVRPEMRHQIVCLRRRRRLRVGPHVAFVFENRSTVLYQLQEISRIEGITDPWSRAVECETYSQLLPNTHNLCATRVLDRSALTKDGHGMQHLAHLDVATFITVGREAIACQSDCDAFDLGYAAATQYVRFEFSDAQRRRFSQQTCPAMLVIDSPDYRAQAPISGSLRRELLEQPFALPAAPCAAALPPNDRAGQHRSAAPMA